MTSRTLIVNPFNSLFGHIPMGTFGICDWLEAAGGRARVLNASAYTETEWSRRLNRAVNEDQPDLLGVVFHWKETLEGVLDACRVLRKRLPNRPIVVGGMTAGFLARDLLDHCPDIDCVIRGDAERAMELLARGVPMDQVPNAWYREGGTARASQIRYEITANELECMSFSRMELLLDYERYLATNRWIPVFIGRGCPYSCSYCGASSKASREHSNRSRAVHRSIPAILRDLRILQAYVKRIFVCYETSRALMTKLFLAISADAGLRKQFKCRYGSFSLLTSELLQAYHDAFTFDPADPSVIELSPETSLDEHRRSIRDPAVSFSQEELVRCATAIWERLGRGARTTVFFSRYHPFHSTRDILLSEAATIHRFWQRLSEAGVRNVTLDYVHLSTDPGSHYWDRAIRSRGFSSPYDALEEALRRLYRPAQDESPINNACLYFPETIDSETLSIYDVACSWLFESVLKGSPAYYRVATKAIGIEPYFSALCAAITRGRKTSTFSEIAAQSLPAILRLVCAELKASSSPRYAQNPTFFEELTALSAAHLERLGLKPPSARSASDRPTFSRERVFLSRYSFFAPETYTLLDGDLSMLPDFPMLYILGKKTRGFATRIYLPMLERIFDGSRTVAEIEAALRAELDPRGAASQSLCAFLIDNIESFTTVQRDGERCPQAEP